MVDGITSVNSLSSTPRDLKTAMTEYQVLSGKIQQSEETGAIDTGSKSSTEYQRELQIKQQQLEIVNHKIDKIKEQIEDCQERAKKYIEQGIEAQDDVAKEYSAASELALANAIKKYTNENEKDPGSYSRDDMLNYMKGQIPNCTLQFMDAVAKFTKANLYLDSLDSNLQTLNLYIGDAKLLETDIKSTQIKYDNAVKREEEAAKAAAKSCDPIGFGKILEGGGSVTYDFIVDDGSFDETTDFLGATNSDNNSEGWQAVQNLDADNDGTVTADEMKSAGIKLVKTTKDSSGNVTSRELVDVDAEEFTSKGGLSIQLSSYSETNLSHELIGTNDSDGDGILDTALRGTFIAKIGDESWAGYRTDDDIDYLQQEFFSNNDLAAKDASGNNFFSQSIVDNQNFFMEHTAESQRLRKEVNEGYQEVRQNSALVNAIKSETKSSAKTQANAIKDRIDAEAAAEEEEMLRQQEEAEATDNADRLRMRNELAQIISATGTKASDIQDWTVEQMRTFVANLPPEKQSEAMQNFASTYGITFNETAEESSTAATQDTDGSSTGNAASSTAGNASSAVSLEDFETDSTMLYKEESNAEGDAVALLNNKNNGKTYQAIDLSENLILRGKLIEKINDIGESSDESFKFDVNDGTFAKKQNGKNGKPEYIKLIEEKDSQGNINYVLAHTFNNGGENNVTNFIKIEL